MNPEELSLQLKKPTGETGKEIAQNLNRSNRNLYELAFELLDIKSDDNLLEIGFGNGKHFPEYFNQQSDIHVSGLDFSEDMCTEAKRLNPKLIESGKLEIHCSDAASTPFPEHTFDIIVAINVLYFWNPPQSYLIEMHRILKPGGILLFGYRPKSSIENFEFTKHNFLLYDAEEAQSLMQSHGFIFQTEKKQNHHYKDAHQEVNLEDICSIFTK